MTDNVFDYGPQELAEMSTGDRLLAQVKTGPWLDAQEFPELQWAVPGLIPEGFGLLIGPPKLGKSWFVLGLMLAVSSGGRALGRIAVEQRPVLYLALEDGDRRMQARVRTLNGTQPTSAGFNFMTSLEPTAVHDLVSAWLEQNPEGVVALDTLGKVMPPALPGEGAYSRDYRVGSSLKRLTDSSPGSSLLVVHHVRKQAGEDWMSSTSGTNGLNGSADWTLSLERGRNEDDAIIRITGRDVSEGEYAATMRDGYWDLAGDDLDQAAQLAQMTTKQQGLGDQSAEIIEFVAQHPEGVKAKQVSDELGMSGENVRRYLSRLVDSGRIERLTRGLYTPVPSVPSVPSGGSIPISGTSMDGTLSGPSVPSGRPSDQGKHTERDTWDGWDTPLEWGRDPSKAEAACADCGTTLRDGHCLTCEARARKAS